MYVELINSYNADVVSVLFELYSPTKITHYT